MTDDEFHRLEAEFVADQREAWERAAELEGAFREHLMERAEAEDRVYFEFVPLELVDAIDVAEAYEEFPAVDTDDGYNE
jgi:hypothetical protein